MRKKGHYGVYKEKEYSVVMIKRNKGILISYESEDVQKGFVISDVSGKKTANGILPTIYEKKIKLSKLDNLYYIDYEIKYEGNIFHLFGKKEDSYFIITGDKSLAEQHGLTWSYDLGFSAKIPKNQCQVIEIRTDINISTMKESNEKRRIITEDE